MFFVVVFLLRRKRVRKVNVQPSRSSPRLVAKKRIVRSETNSVIDVDDCSPEHAPINTVGAINTEEVDHADASRAGDDYTAANTTTAAPSDVSQPVSELV